MNPNSITVLILADVTEHQEKHIKQFITHHWTRPQQKLGHVQLHFTADSSMYSAKQNSPVLSGMGKVWTVHLAIIGSETTRIDHYDELRVLIRKGLEFFAMKHGDKFVWGEEQEYLLLDWGFDGDME